MSTPADSTSAESASSDQRMDALSAAMLRIGASLDLDTVLHEVVEGARALVGARYAALVTVDEAGEPQDFVASGLGAEERRRMAAPSDGPRRFEGLPGLTGSRRLADLSALAHALGLSADLPPSTPVQGTPIRYRGARVGSFHLVGKEGGTVFEGGDEAVLQVFAALAAAAIGNARAYRAERRALADLETLVETSPVGVVVFDARTGRPVSLNREARRIVEGLRLPGHATEQLLEVVTCRFADGREIALDRLPLAGVLGDAELVRAEEVVLSVPDGRTLTTLINATPIRSPDGAVDSVVVTLQDLAPLEELHRMRARFVGMVSHELRLPLAAIKGSAATVLGAPGDFGAAEVQQFLRIIEEQADRMSRLIADLLDAGRLEAGELPVAPEPADIAALVEGARTAFLSGGARRDVVLDLPPDLPRVLADGRRIGQVLGNLLSNAARHSPESSPIRIEARREDAHVAVSVSDEGRGFGPETLPKLFRRYAGAPAGAAGSGLGLAICKGLVEAHGGRIRAESGGEGQGARFTFTLPVAGEAGGEPAGGLKGPAAAPRGPGERPRILVVDDDPQALRHARDALAGAGYTPLVTGDHRELPRILEAERPALALLDLVLPETDGVELMRTVPGLADIPVIFVSGYGRDEAGARALEAGAEDYLVKPFSPTELAARIGAARRRRAGLESFVLGELAIDYGRRRASVAGEPVSLTATEYELLRALSLAAGRVVTHDALLRRVWGGRSADPKRVRAFVKRLRNKLGDDASKPTWIFNERGAGYRMAKPGSD